MNYEDAMAKVNEEYAKLCTLLGDIEVKLKGLNNQKDLYFEQLSSLDSYAKKVVEDKEAADKETKDEISVT